MSKDIYCTYLTVYSGNKLPPFYIGSTSIDKINKGYHGSVSSKKYEDIWKFELKHNPNLFKTKILTRHNTREEALEKEEYFQRELNVVQSSMYINMCIANRKLFINEFTEDHKKNLSLSQIGNKKGKGNKGRIFSEESKKKMSESLKIYYGFNSKTHTEETKIKISQTLIGRKRPEDFCEKMSNIMTGKKRGPYKKKENYVKRTFSAEHKRKLSEAKRGRKFSEEHKKKLSDTHKRK